MKKKEETAKNLLNMDVSKNAHINKIIRIEGGYTDGKKDRRGPTNIGINADTLSEYEQFKKDKNEKLPESFTHNIKKITPDLAYEIYDEMYLKRYNIDKIENEFVRKNMLDMAINSGFDRGAKWYQESLNKALGTEMDVDGVVGPETREALKKAEKEGVLRSVHNEVLLKRMQDYQRISKDPDQAEYLKGWLGRVQEFSWPPLSGEKPKH